MRNNTAYYKQKRDEYRLRAKSYIAEVKQNSACVVCGESHVACLVFHHKDPSTKEGTIGNALTNGWSLSRIKKELEKCEVMCANCHMKHHYIAEI